MSRGLHARLFVAAALAAGIAAPAIARAQALPPVRTDSTGVARARADSAQRPYTAADVAFINGMIAHHAQAVLMGGWAPSHGASDAVRTLCARIVNAQRDEIHFMQQWLADRQLPIPTPNISTIPDDMAMDMPGMRSAPLMPGMLTPAQLRALDSARGPAFDRLFLRDMIQHHTGAVGMVRDLFATYGAGQDETIFKLATDINVDQTTEIARMQRMLVESELGIGTE
jgi:uncharacterized protein (DUF305 family)